MRKLQNNLIGIDQGSVIVFSDFEDGGEMWTGKGPRSRRITVKFHETYKTTPVVHVTMDMFDMDQNTNQRADVSTENISRSRFSIVFKTWGDTKIARARVSWLAIGEVRGQDEWSID